MSFSLKFLTLAGSDFSDCSLKVCEPLDIVFLRGVVVPSCEGRTNSILPPSTTMLGAGGKFSVLPTVSQYPKRPAFSPYKGWICLQQRVKARLENVSIAADGATRFDNSR